MSDFFLTPFELQRLTGRRRANAQMRHLRQRGIPFELDANNHPIVMRHILTQPTERVTTEPQLCLPPKKRKSKCVVAKPTNTCRAVST